MAQNFFATVKIKPLEPIARSGYMLAAGLCVAAIFLHLTLLPEAVPEEYHGYLHGSVLIDFVGQCTWVARSPVLHD